MYDQPLSHCEGYDQPLNQCDEYDQPITISQGDVFHQALSHLQMKSPVCTSFNQFHSI